MILKVVLMCLFPRLWTLAGVGSFPSVSADCGGYKRKAADSVTGCAYSLITVHYKSMIHTLSVRVVEGTLWQNCFENHSSAVCPTKNTLSSLNASSFSVHDAVLHTPIGAIYCLE